MRKTLFILMMAFVAVSFAGRLNITNDTGNYEFYYVYISPSSADSWGDDWLGSSETISPGNSRTFRLNNGEYDVQIEDEDGDTYIFWNVEVSGTVDMWVDLDNLGEQDWGRAGSSASVGGTAPVTIENDLGSWTIWYVYGDPSDSPWGEDRLGSDLLDPGESLTFYVPAGDYYDFKCEDEDGDVYTIWEVWVDSDGFYWSVDLSDMD
ncbi:MAG: hypothetical protein J7K88_06610 [Candidatus Fermentibacteraceae bacterium]|nr:hypothetical protein [Candidatus Fermentibacteraceae bacterium]